MVQTHMYVGYLDIKSNDVICPNITPKSRIKQNILLSTMHASFNHIPV